MKFSEFIKKYNNKKVERFDSNAKYQCVDLFLAYLDEVLRLGAIIPIGIINAFDIYNKTHKWTPHSTKIKNDPNAVPQYGDVIIWSSGYGPAGHVAIYTEGDVNKFKAFSQNDPLGSPCVIREYTYKNVLGWLRPNNMPKEETELEACLIAHKQAMDKVSKQEEMIKNLQVELSSCNALRNQGLSAQDILQTDIKRLESELAIKVNQVSLMEGDIKALEAEVIALKAQANKEENKPVPYKKLYQEAQAEIKRIETLITTDYTKLGKSKVVRAMQRALIDIESYIVNHGK